MINEQENKASLNKMSDLEYTKNDTEMMRYRVNGLSYKIGLLAMVFSILGAFICLNSVQPNDIQTIFKILLNVVVLLGGFLCAEMVKNYSHKGAIAQIVFGGITAARIFYYPLLLMIHYNGYKDAIAAADDVAAKSHEKYLAQTILSYEKQTKYATAFLPADGNLRAIFAMICFAISAICFITAGIIGFKRAQKLSTYMNSIKESK